jgi:integration host factor subunit beta
MATITKKELIEQVADATKQKRIIVKQVVQSFLDGIVVQLGRGNRLEFRDFGVFEVRTRKARIAQNPKQPSIKVQVPAKRTVKFKVGRMMKKTLGVNHRPAEARAASPAAKPAELRAAAPAAKP